MEGLRRLRGAWGAGQLESLLDEELSQNLWLRGISRHHRNQHPDTLEKGARTLASPRSLDPGKTGKVSFALPLPATLTTTAEALLCVAWC